MDYVLKVIRLQDRLEMYIKLDRWDGNKFKKIEGERPIPADEYFRMIGKPKPQTISVNFPTVNGLPILGRSTTVVVEKAAPTLESEEMRAELLEKKEIPAEEVLVEKEPEKVSDTSVVEPTVRVDYETMKMKDLQTLAKAKGIKMTRGMKKEEIVEALKKMI